MQERIRLNYGSNYGLRIESEYGIGTVVTVRIPAIQYSDNQNDLLSMNSISAGIHETS